MLQLQCNMRKLLHVLLLLAFTTMSFAQMVTVCNGHYYSVYDLQLQCPRQVGWTINPSDLGDTQRDPSWIFVQDIDNPMAYANHYDFTRSGFDRGHLCPAQDRAGDLRAMRSTFRLSNIAPQAPSLNRGPWKSTEIFCRKAASIYDSVKVVALPLFLDRDTTFIGCHRLAVPHAFIKVAWLPSNDSVIGLWYFWNH